MIEIVEANEADVPAVCELLAVLFGQEGEFTADPEKQAQGLRAILAGPDVGQMLILRHGGGDAGGRGIPRAFSPYRTGEGR